MADLAAALERMRAPKNKNNETKDAKVTPEMQEKINRIEKQTKESLALNSEYHTEQDNDVKVPEHPLTGSALEVYNNAREYNFSGAGGQIIVIEEGKIDVLFDPKNPRHMLIAKDNKNHIHKTSSHCSKRHEGGEIDGHIEFLKHAKTPTFFRYMKCCGRGDDENTATKELNFMSTQLLALPAYLDATTTTNQANNNNLDIMCVVQSAPIVAICLQQGDQEYRIWNFNGECVALLDSNKIATITTIKDLFLLMSISEEHFANIEVLATERHGFNGRMIAAHCHGPGPGQASLTPTDDLCNNHNCRYPIVFPTFGRIIMDCKENYVLGSALATLIDDGGNGIYDNKQVTMVGLSKSERSTFNLNTCELNIKAKVMSPYPEDKDGKIINAVIDMFDPEHFMVSLVYLTCGGKKLHPIYTLANDSEEHNTLVRYPMGTNKESDAKGGAKGDKKGGVESGAKGGAERDDY